MFRPIELIINFLAGIVEFLLSVRFLLKLVGAAPDSGFVKWIYENSNTFLQPFNNIISDLTISNRYAIEFNTLIAILVYALITYIIILAVRQASSIRR